MIISYLFKDKYSPAYPQLNQAQTSSLTPSFLSNLDGGSRRLASRTIISHVGDKSRLKSSKINDRDLNEVLSKIKGGISNLSYYKVEFAINEIEEAVEMLKSLK